MMNKEPVKGTGEDPRLTVWPVTTYGTVDNSMGSKTAAKMGWFILLTATGYLFGLLTFFFAALGTVAYLLLYFFG